MNPNNIIEALKSVPEIRLRIIDLAWKLVGDDGSISPEKTAFYRQELEEAITEAEAYMQATREAVCHLREIPRSEP